MSIRRLRNTLLIGLASCTTTAATAEAASVDSGSEPTSAPSSLASTRNLSGGRAPSALAQLSLELLNRCRADPTAEAARFGIDLNEGLSPGTLPDGPRQPLAFEPHLVESAYLHAEWLLANDKFQHSGEGGTNSRQRMTAAGYDFSGSASSGENLAWRGTTGFFNPATYIIRQHEDLFVDEGISGRGHRKAMVNNNFEEVGIATANGPFESGGTTYNSLIQAQNFAGTSNRGPFITGVVYDDSVTADDFYTVGEGWSDVTVTAKDESGNVIASMQSWPGGGYSLEVPAGSTYSVTASNGGLSGTVTVTGVVVDSENVKIDLNPNDATAVPSPPPSRQIHITVSSHAIPDNWAISPADGDAMDDGAMRIFSGLNPDVDYVLSIATNG